MGSPLSNKEEIRKELSLYLARTPTNTKGTGPFWKFCFLI